jgi:hypothetical protein
VASGRCAPAWPKDALRISFGIIWLIDAVLKWPGPAGATVPAAAIPAQTSLATAPDGAVPGQLPHAV